MAPSGEASLAFDADTVVLITGSSRGLGFHLVKGILETTQSHVVATARNVEKANALKELEAKFSGRVQLVNLDTASEDSIKAAVAVVSQKHNGIDLLFNNAGIDEGVDVSCLDVTATEYEKILKVNVLGPFLTTTNFLPLLRKKQSRVVVNMSSGLGSITRNRQGILNPEQNPVGNKWVAYNSSKAALNMRWVDTDMGGGNARKLGMNSAPLDVDTSIKLQLKVLRSLTCSNNGEYLDENGKKMEY